MAQRPRKRDFVRHWLGGTGGSSRSETSSGTASSSAPTKPAPAAVPPSPVTPAPPASTSSALLGGEILKQALESLSEEERLAIEYHIGAADITTTLNQVLGAAQEKRATCVGKNWTFEIGNRRVVLRDEAAKTIQFLDKIKAVGDVAVNADPLHAGLPWAGIRLLLEIAVAEKTQMAVLLGGLNTTLYMVNRLDVYMHFLGRLPATRARSNFQAQLVSMYALILRFLSRAILLFNKSTGRRTIDALWKPDEVASFQAECDRLAANVEIEAQNVDRDLFVSLSDSLDELKAINSSIKDIETGIARLWMATEEEERVKILKWTSPISYETNHENARSGRTSDTCEWIFQHKNYIEWESSDDSMILWLHGIPGAGKTKSISNLIDNLLTKPNNEGLAYFYCNRYEDARRDPMNILRSFVRQLAISQQSHDLQKPLIDLYQSKKSKGFASEGLTYEEVEKLLPQLMQAFPCTTLIIDALDECHDGSRVKLIDTLDHMIRACPRLKIFISSRRDADITHQLLKGANIGISATDNDDDIRKFIHAEVAKNEPFRAQALSSELRQEVIDTLQVQSKGMFQWAALQISQLLNLKRESAIQSRLGKLPKDLKKAYNEIYSTIQEQEGSEPRIAQVALQWILSSVKPLTADILVAAACQDIDSDELQPIDIDIEFVLGACRNLIVIDSINECRLCHLSCQEYFEEHHKELLDAGKALCAAVCLKLLHCWDFNFRVDFNNHLIDLFHYVAEHWYKQIEQLDESFWNERLTNLVQRFIGTLETSSQAYQNWHVWYRRRMEGHRSWIENLPGSQRPIEDALNPPENPMLPISLFRFPIALPNLYPECKFDLTKTNADSVTLLEIACSRGNMPMVRLLLQSGADIDAIPLAGADGVLHAAVKSRSVELIRLLLDHGAKVDLPAFDSYGHSVLSAAAELRDEDIFRLLLSRVTDAKALEAKDYASLLVQVILDENKTYTQLLLDSGANANAFSERREMDALTAAASMCNEEIVHLLLSRGADPKACLGSGRALIAASRTHEAFQTSKQRIAVVRALIKAGADVNLQSSAWPTCALRAAIITRDFKLIELLLHEGADPAIQYRSQETVLHSVLEKEDRKMLEVFLPYLRNMPVVDVSTIWASRDSVLQRTSGLGLTEVVHLLVEKFHARIDITDAQGRTLLHLAARNGHAHCVNYLIDSGLSAADTDHFGRTALHYAAMSTQVDVVERLLQVGFVATDSSSIWSPLHWACRRTIFEQLELLMRNNISATEVNTEEPKDTWSPISIGIFHHSYLQPIDLERAEQLLAISSTDFTTTSMRTEGTWQGRTCNGCDFDIYGEAFQCCDCIRFYYCFMCKVASAEAHPGHDFRPWFRSPSSYNEPGLDTGI